MKNFCAGIHVLIRKRDKYLILKKSGSDKDEPGHWDLPGGGIEFNEQPLGAALRETMEEAGIKIRLTNVLMLWAMPHKTQWSIEIVAQGIYLSGKIKLSPEHSTYKWVNKKELLKVKPGTVHLKKLIKFLSNKKYQRSN
ncbi:MAG: NUDIX domain-containing protein [Candidatus Pacebacteria bacterium]|nr:NUDIX domain-containing protein [Candidatus Paceibacterota bacterium]